MIKLNDIDNNIIRLALDVLETKKNYENMDAYDSDELEIIIFESVVKAAEFYEYTDAIEPLVRHIQSLTNIFIDRGTSLISQDDSHDPNWIKDIPEEQKVYSKAYEDHLKNGGIPHHIVNQISRNNTEILSLLGDPENPNAFLRRGLVIGDVQSGKTSNYLSLLTKAADAGYKFIIVIAGIHNNLRKQTQQRVEEGFIGWDNINRKKVGVGLTHRQSTYPHPVALTTQDADFSKSFGQQMQADIKEFASPVICVIKKNVTTLKNLVRWLDDFKQKNGRQNSKIDVPMLLIDDESDNASINTNDPDRDPTQTNRYLREILHMFDKSCYVGYTATPFANIFIDPDSYGSAKDDLFPNEFIYSLESPTNYMGANKLFLNDDFDHLIVRLNEDEVSEDLPISHKKTLIVNKIPLSLKYAINNFLIAKVIRNLRGQEHKHCSMLINVSPYVDVQVQIRNHVLDYLEIIKNEILKSAALNSALSNPTIQSIYKTFYEEYQSFELEDNNESMIEWNDILSGLIKLFDDSQKRYELDVLVINSKSKETLDYDRYEKENKGLMAIVIGGFSLSRGLTIEGLTISYFHRSTKMYDTLLQMGRWFGYRPGYEDLCRVYMTPDALRWYQHITNATLDLKDQIIEMNQNKKSPKEFGLYVESSEDGLIITAKNKMKTGEVITLNRSYSCSLKELFCLSQSVIAHRENRALFKNIWDELIENKQPMTRYTSAYAFKSVSTVNTLKHLSLFNFGMDEYITNRITIENCIEYLRNIADQHPVMDITFITKQQSDTDPATANSLKPLDRAVFIDNDQQIYVINRSRLGSPKDEFYGLGEIGEKILNDKVLKDKAKAYRKERNRPLLMLYLIDPTIDKKSFSDTAKEIPTFALSFPDIDSNITASRTIVANRVYNNYYSGESTEMDEE